MSKNNIPDDTLNYLYALGGKGIRFGLEPLRKLLSAYKNPQNNFPSIHVAGCFFFKSYCRS